MLVKPDVKLPLPVVHPLVAEEGVIPFDMVVPFRIDVIAGDARVGPEEFVSARGRGGDGRRKGKMERRRRRDERPGLNVTESKGKKR